jgi:integrator complex subunit 5
MALLTKILTIFSKDDSQTEICVSSLLEASVRHGPHFDWVVAHVGGCFPDTVISR